MEQVPVPTSVTLLEGTLVQSMPAGLEVTWPPPAPSSSTEMSTEKVAPTVVSPVMVRSQPPAPEQAPVQPVKVVPAAGVASRCTAVPEARLFVQAAAAQLMEPSGEATEPAPFTLRVRL